MLETLQKKTASHPHAQTFGGLLLVVGGAFFAGHTVGSARWELGIEHGLAALLVVVGCVAILTVRPEGLDPSGPGIGTSAGRRISYDLSIMSSLSDDVIHIPRRSRPSKEGAAEQPL